MGFEGATDNYYDPRNSFLCDVIDRRTGIPISLSVLYLEVSRRVGVLAQGVNFPGHFLVRVAIEDAWLFLDPFSRGRVMTLVISDVVGDDLSIIGSGPTVSDPSTFADARAILERCGGLAAYPPRVRGLGGTVA